MPDLGPAERALLEQGAAELFEEVLTEGGLADDDPRVVAGGPRRDAFELLRRLGLLVPAPEEASGGGDGPGRTTYVGVDPAAVQSHVVAPLGQRGAELLAESAQWAQAFGALAQTWRRTPQPTSGPFTELRGEAIDPFIASVVADAQSELLTAQPQTGRDAAALRLAAERDVAALERGVRMRTLYQHSARRSAITHDYVAAVTARGAEVRTLDEFFNRLIVVDRRLAVVPGHQGLAVALVVREPSLVAYLADMFERHWERGRPFASTDSALVKEIAAEQRAMTIRMLVEGHADPASAKRMGVSPRTYAAYVADLKAEHEVTTRFQLGYALGRLGITGEEQPGEAPGEPPAGGGGQSPGECTTT